MARLPQKTVGGPELPSVLVVLMVTLSLLFVGAGGIACLSRLAEAREAGGELTRESVIAAVAWLAGGVAAASVLWALAYVVRKAYDTTVLLRNILTWLRPALHEPAAPVAGQAATPQQAAPPDQTSGTELLQQIAVQLAEVRTNIMLSPEQLEIKRRRYQQRRAGELTGKARQAIEAGKFTEAEQALAALADEVPGDKRCGELREMLERTRAEALARDLQEHVKRVEDLMAVAEFGQAEELARMFVEAHPTCDQAAELLQRARREGAAYQAEIRQKIYKDVQRRAKARQWRAALAAARKLVEACPDSREAESVTLQMTTLETNARLEEVRQLRDEIRDMIERRRYAEAVEIAKDVLKRFPESHFAAELRGQIGRLRELAAGGGAN